MFPELFRLGPLSIKTYGFFVATGFLLGLNYIKSQSKFQGISPETAYDLSFYVLISSIIGGRIFYVLLNWQDYANNLIEIFQIWSGGLVFYGGFIFALITIIIYCRKKRVKIWKLIDLLTPATFLGLAIGRIGCLSAGCCHGKETSLPWGIVFHHPLSLAPLGVKLHPTQIYESLFSFLLFVFLHRLNNQQKKFDGETFFSGLLLYGIFRFIIEYFRGDDRGAMIFGLYPSQAISVGLILTSIIFLSILWKQKKKSELTVTTPTRE